MILMMITMMRPSTITKGLDRWDARLKEGEPESHLWANCKQVNNKQTNVKTNYILQGLCKVMLKLPAQAGLQEDQQGCRERDGYSWCSRWSGRTVHSSTPVLRTPTTKRRPPLGRQQSKSLLCLTFWLEFDLAGLSGERQSPWSSCHGYSEGGRFI